MIYNYCTLFDSGYLSRGLLLYESLMKHSKNAFLYVFAFDDQSYEILKKMNLPKMKVISLKEFEDKELLRIKPTRSRAEYCWTCSSSTILYVLKKFNASNCTYVDADIIFYSDPKILIEEMKKKSISIIEHRYTKEYDQSKLSGKYCVQFMTFKNNQRGLTALRWWREKCIEWCYAKREGNRFGDQKYLDDWTTRFKGVHVIQNMGAGVAPWNVQQYKVFEKNGELFGKIRNQTVKIIFFHYHQLKFLPKNKVDLGGYKLEKEAVKIIYLPIIKKLREINKTLKEQGVKNPEPISRINFKDYLKIIVRKIQRRSNIYKL